MEVLLGGQSSATVQTISRGTNTSLLLGPVRTRTLAYSLHIT